MCDARHEPDTLFFIAEDDFRFYETDEQAMHWTAEHGELDAPAGSFEPSAIDPAEATKAETKEGATNTEQEAYSSDEDWGTWRPEPPPGLFEDRADGSAFSCWFQRPHRKSAAEMPPPTPGACGCL